MKNYTILSFLIIILSVFSCENKNEDVFNGVFAEGELGTTEIVSITNIRDTSTTLNCLLSFKGKGYLLERGVCWSTTRNPTTDNGHVAVKDTGTVTLKMSKLTPGTLYYVRPYVTNNEGTAYGNELNFTTKNIPTLTTASAPSILTAVSATISGTVTNDGGDSVTVRGVCWGTTTKPTVALTTKTTNGAGKGVFNAEIIGLTMGTSYYARAFATNAYGAAYGNEIVFTTQGLPTLSTNTVTNRTDSTATCGGTITSNGGATITVSGVCWSTSQTPTTANSKTTDGSSASIYTSSITGLSPGTTYYVRAYATNSVGTSYGNQQTFNSTTSIPSLTTSNITSVTSATATSGGTIISNGGAAITVSGICWSTSATPTTANSKTSDGSTSGSFTSSLTGLSPGVTYYVRAYATNSVGTAYGNNQTFNSTTSIPSLTTSNVTAVTGTTATCGGTITSNGGAAITVSGVCWSTSQTPTTANSKTTDGSSASIFTSSITGLLPGTTYYVRAYATNSVGTAYGNQQTFNSTTSIPSLTTSNITAVTSATATSGGTIISNGGAAITVSGVCWSTSATPTTASSKTTDGSTSGSFTSSLTGLSPGVTYYVRAYATNSIGTAYGNQQTFNSITTIPSLITSNITSVTSATATCGGTITSNGGATITASGVCWSTSTNPTTVNNKTTDGSTTGPFISSLTGLLSGTTYYIRAYATNSVGTSYGNQVIITTLANSGTVTDIEGNVYNFITIGTQKWMVENLKTTKYNDGTSIPLVNENTAWLNLSTPGYCFYVNDAANKITYGALYNWYTVNTGKLAPTGWHVPTDAEWTTLENYLIANGYNYDGTTTGNKIAKSLAATTLWSTYTTVGTIGNDLTKNNTSGFTALPVGYRGNYGAFAIIGQSCHWWSSTEVSTTNAWYRELYYWDNNLGRYDSAKRDGFYVRCVRDVN